MPFWLSSLIAAHSNIPFVFCFFFFNFRYVLLHLLLHTFYISTHRLTIYSVTQTKQAGRSHTVAKVTN